MGGGVIFYLYTFLPAVLVAVLIRVDAKRIGPYFAASSLLPGFGGGVAPFMVKGSPLRFALIRRLAYPVLMGAVLNFVHADVFEAALAGLTTGFLLSWPAWIAPHPPDGVAFRDALYHLFYLLVILSSGALSLLGFYFVAVLKELSGGDITGYLLENLFDGVATLLVVSALAAFTKGVSKSLSAKAHRRIQTHEQSGSNDAKHPDSEQ